MPMDKELTRQDIYKRADELKNKVVKGGWDRYRPPSEEELEEEENRCELCGEVIPKEDRGRYEAGDHLPICSQCFNNEADAEMGRKKNAPEEITNIKELDKASLATFKRKFNDLNEVEKDEIMTKLKEDKKEIEKAGKICYNCGNEIIGEEYIYYHGDQDDMVCEECAKILTHNDTAYAGMNVYETGQWGKKSINKASRTTCELCGRELKEPETDPSKTAICEECMRGQMEGIKKNASGGSDERREEILDMINRMKERGYTLGEITSRINSIYGEDFSRSDIEELSEMTKSIKKGLTRQEKYDKEKSKNKIAFKQEFMSEENTDKDPMAQKGKEKFKPEFQTVEDRAQARRDGIKWEDMTEEEEMTEEESDNYAAEASGATNMFNVKLVEELSGLSRETIMEIMRTYGELKEKFSKAFSIQNNSQVSNESLAERYNDIIDKQNNVKVESNITNKFMDEELERSDPFKKERKQDQKDIFK
jgi:hypothetical protein